MGFYPGNAVQNINQVCKVGNKIYAVSNLDTFIEGVNTSGNQVFKLFLNSDRGELELNGSTGGTVIHLSAYTNSYISNKSLGVGSNIVDNSAILHATSTTKGFLPPVMTTAQKNAISSPATGLIVYDTTLNKLCVYTGAAWETITSA